MPTWVSSPRHRAIVAALVAARTAAGLTQRDLANRLGKPPSYVAKVEIVERNLPVAEFLDWCDAIGVEVIAILEGASGS